MKGNRIRVPALPSACLGARWVAGLSRPGPPLPPRGCPARSLASAGGAVDGSPKRPSLGLWRELGPGGRHPYAYGSASGNSSGPLPAAPWAGGARTRKSYTVDDDWGESDDDERGGARMVRGGPTESAEEASYP